MNLRYADDNTLMEESEKEPKMKVKEESEEGGLKLNIQKTKIMASSPIVHTAKSLQSCLTLSRVPRALSTSNS